MQKDESMAGNSLRDGELREWNGEPISQEQTDRRRLTPFSKDYNCTKIAFPGTEANISS